MKSPGVTFPSITFSPSGITTNTVKKAAPNSYVQEVIFDKNDLQILVMMFLR
jgi:hypothetical protein